MIQDQLNQSVSKNNVVIDVQTQSLGKTFEFNQTPRESVSYVQRTEFSQDYDFRAKGRYTSQVLNKQVVKEFNRRGSVVAGGVEFNFDSTEANYCNTHNEIKDYILFSKVENYRIFDTICKNCLSQINYRNPNPAKAELFDTVIIDNKEKIIQIRQNKLQLDGGNTSETLNVLKENILPLADELIYLSEVFDHEVCGKISGNFAKAEDLAKLKNFINSIELTSNGDPNVFGIGKNEPLKHKYIKLALFLVHFNGLNSDQLNHNGLTESLKTHMLKIVQLRKTIIVKITAWLKYLAGSFFDYAFELEGLSIDEAFRKNLQIDYVSEEDIFKLRFFFEGELKKRDDRIRLLEDENSRYKREIEALRGNLVHLTEQEALIADLKMKLQKLDAEWSYQKQTITTITTENSRLNNLNSEYLSQIEIFRREIAQLKIDFEAKLRTCLDNMKNEYENKINEYIFNLNQWKGKYAEFESKYTIEIRSYTSEKEQLIGQIKHWNAMYDNDVKSLTQQLDSLTAEFNNLKVTLKNQVVQINTLTVDKEGLEKNIEGLRFHIKSLEGELKSASGNIQVLFKEREEARTQINVYITEINGYKVNIENYKNNISGLETAIKNYTNQINILTKERDEFRSQLIVISQERDGLRINLENARTHITNIETTIKNLTININVLTKERDEARSQIIVLKGDVDKHRGEITVITNIKISYESRINELQRKIEELSNLYSKLHAEYNVKITIITNLEKKVGELDGVVSSSEGQINNYFVIIKKYEEELNSLKKDNNELRVKLLIINERDAEISRLKLALSACRDEWTKLSESYEGLLVDIKNQISINEALRMFIYELQSKIESHNQQIGGLDSAIRQQLEILTRQTLSKKSIEYNSNNDAVRKSQSEIEALRTKLGRIESAKLTKSAVFSNINITIDSGSNKNVNVSNNNASQYVRYIVENNVLNQSVSQNNSSNVIVSSTPSNVNNVYRSTTYEQKYTSPSNYNYRSTYDKGYGANVFNLAYSGTNANLNSSTYSNNANVEVEVKTSEQAQEKNTTVVEEVTEIKEVKVGAGKEEQTNAEATN